MPDDKDDLEAVRTLVETLEPFDNDERARIIRWASEKLGMSPQAPLETPRNPLQQDPRNPPPPSPGSDIKSFIDAKKPRNDTQFTAAVAYYYQFDASSAEKNETIGSELLQEACRKAGRARLTAPSVTLNNTLKAGYLDKGGERGQFRINSVGENLVAMVLPDGNASDTPKRPRRKKAAKKKGARKKKATKKKTAKKKATRKAAKRRSA